MWFVIAGLIAAIIVVVLIIASSSRRVSSDLGSVSDTWLSNDTRRNGNQDPP
jgi:hypothetical protein